MKLNVGCGRNIMPGWVNIDRLQTAEVVGADLNNCCPPSELLGPALGHTARPLPFEDNCVDEFLLSHVIEHIANALPLMQELHRIAKPGAVATVRVPYGSSDDAWEDPTHVRSYYTGSFGYFSQPYYWRADYNFRGDWQPLNITLFTNKPGVTMERIHAERNLVTEMVATLVAVKPIREPLRELMVHPQIVIR